MELNSNSQSSDNKRIAKNTIYLYFRMLLTMIVGLYTSRVILQILGIEDYGIYSAVGGVVGMLTFLNAALATGSSRFLTYELGRKDYERLRKMFSTLLSVHIILGFIIVFLCETIGLWLISNKLIIPENRFDAALWCFHLSVFTCFVTVVQVPYNATIISHEKMDIYAYVSIVDSCLKLAIVYLLLISPIDKLIFYAILLMLVNAGVMFFYIWYCSRKYEESTYTLILDKPIIKEVLSYSAWNLLANIGVTLKNQGSVVLINMFFNPAVVTAQTIANKVSLVADQFVNNFRTAANPQIVKKYAALDLQGSKSLMLASTKYSFYLVLLIGLPIILVAEPVLRLWLGQVPEYSVSFLRLIMVTSIVNVFNSSLYTAIYATGRVRDNAISGSIIWLLVLPISYVFFRLGYSPVVIAIVTLVCNILLSFVQKPILLHRIVDYSWSEILFLYGICTKVTLIAVPIPVITYLMKRSLFTNRIMESLFLVLISVSCVTVSVWIFGLDNEMRDKLMNYAKNKLNR